MKLRVAVAGAIAHGTVIAGAIGPAGAEPTWLATGGAKATVLGNVVIDANDPGVAYVTARYTCPEDAEAHLWVSVKQVPDAQPDNALKDEGSSAIASAWLQRHPAPTEFTCDGTWHVGTFSVDNGQTEYGFGELQPGQVYVQFCLTGHEIAPEEPAWVGIDMRFAVAR
jgi:hypothetical protein